MDTRGVLVNTLDETLSHDLQWWLLLKILLLVLVLGLENLFVKLIIFISYYFVKEFLI
jgi:hypothetical protein